MFLLLYLRLGEKGRLTAMEKPPLEMTALMELLSTNSNLIQNAEAEGGSTLLRKHSLK